MIGYLIEKNVPKEILLKQITWAAYEWTHTQPTHGWKKKKIETWIGPNEGSWKLNIDTSWISHSQPAAIASK